MTCMAASTRPTQIVDENDNLIGHKVRLEIDWETDIYRVTSLWVTNSRGDVLLAQRSHTKRSDPGKWGPAAAGTLEKDETYESNVYKEAEEEIGLTGVTFVQGPKLREDTPRRLFCQFYSAVVDWPLSSFVIESEEVEQIKWMPKKEFLQDVRKHPEAYVASMSVIVQIFYSDEARG
jgi:isopentenyldiphosphate isomerase